MQNKKNVGLIMTLFFFLILTAFMCYINRYIRIHALFMDDLDMWYYYDKQSLFEFSFPYHTSPRFRPVCWFLTYLQMAIVGTNIKGYLIFNYVTNAILTFTIYGMCERISGSRIASFLASLCFLASRLSYYQIGQALGYMETLACFFGLLVLYLLYRYLTYGRDNYHFLRSREIFQLNLEKDAFFYLAIAAYVLVSFTHERYIVLVVLFYVVLILESIRNNRYQDNTSPKASSKLWIIPAVAFAGIMAIRFIFIGRFMPAGTGGTEVTETFSIGQALGYCISQILYLFGINDGPEYLCAVSWDNTTLKIKLLVIASIICYGLIIVGYIASMINDSKNASRLGKKVFFEKLAVAILFASFIGGCIVCSSVTIRLEMRWIYISFAAMQIFACYMIRGIAGTFGSADNCVMGKPDDEGHITLRDFNRPLIAVMAVYLVYVLLSIKTNIYCRSCINNIYFMEGQNRANSIADQTIYRYGADEVLGKTIYLVNTNYELSEFYCETLLKPFGSDKSGNYSHIEMIDSIEQLGIPNDVQTNADRCITEDAVFLTEDPTTGQYIPFDIRNR